MKLPATIPTWSKGNGQGIKNLNKMTKKSLIRLVINLQKQISDLFYMLYLERKGKLPRLQTIRQSGVKRKTPRGKRTHKFFPSKKEYEFRESTAALQQWNLSKRKTKRKFSKKQLAAQRLFAKRAKAGTLRRRKR